MSVTLAASISFLIVALFGGVFANLLWRVKARQNVSEFLDAHQSKQGTPTMGGILMLAGSIAGLVVALVVGAGTAEGTRPTFGPVLLTLGLMLGFATLGFVDDYVMPQMGKKRGLRWKAKLALQVMVAIPFVALSSGPLTALSVVAGTLFLVWWANAFNITDGVDGLAAGATAIALGGLFQLTLWRAVQPEDCLIVAVIGACLGFLWWNAPKARMFMGDTGSMTLGAAFGYYALHHGLWWQSFVVGGVFAAEALSVIIQLASVKARKGARIFRSSPIHHHFEALGWTEAQISVRFWLIGLACAAVAVWLTRESVWGP